MKITLVLLFTFSLFAAEKKDVVKEEVDHAVSTVYEKHNEDQIVENNEDLKKCKETHKDSIEKAEECVRDIVGALTDEDLEKLGDKIKLSSYDTKASKSAKTIREYLSERMTSALRGEPKNGVKEISLRDMKFVDHALYAKIYRSQIGKNILLETTNYCISNFGHIKGPEFLVLPPMFTEIDFSKSKRKVKKMNPKSPTISKISELDTETKKYTAIDTNEFQAITPEVLPKDFWKNAYEYEICDDYSSDSTSKCTYSTKKGEVSNRSSDMINDFKNAEFDFGPGYMKAKISFCTQTVIKNMCERYRCQNIYGNDVTQGVKDNCDDVIGVPVTAKDANHIIPTDSSEGDVSGIMACGLMDRLKEYRRVIAALDQIDGMNKESKGKGKGFKITQAFAGQYTGGKGEKSIEDITTIASSEFKDVSFVDKDEMTKLREECFDDDNKLDESNDKCAALVVNELDEKQTLAIRAEMEAETSAYLKRVESLKGNKEGLMEFLKDQGLDKKYAGDSLTSEELALLISNQYKSQRASLKKSMMDKYNQTRNLVTSGMSDEQKSTAKSSKLTEVAKTNLVNMEKEKEKLETLLQYNNILTSYLGATIDEGGDKTETTLAYQRQIELDQSKDKDDGEFYEKYNQFFNEDQKAQSTQDASLQVDLSFIDSILGNEEDKTDANLVKNGSE